MQNLHQPPTLMLKVRRPALQHSLPAAFQPPSQLPSRLWVPSIAGTKQVLVLDCLQKSPPPIDRGLAALPWLNPTFSQLFQHTEVPIVVFTISDAQLTHNDCTSNLP